MLGRILISLISMIFWFLRASAAFFWLAYFSLPRSRILQTGGSALGEISTRSRPASSAASSASLMETLPRLLPSASMSWTRGTLMSRFERGPSLVGADALNGLRMVNSPWLLTINLCRHAEARGLCRGGRASVNSTAPANNHPPKRAFGEVDLASAAPGLRMALSVAEGGMTNDISLSLEVGGVPIA